MARALLAALLLTASSGCASPGSRITGVDSLIEWQAVDHQLGRKDLDSPWVYSFALQLRDTQGRRVTYTTMEHHLYQPGVGTSSATVTGTWVIPARGGVLRLPVWSSLRCGGEGRCQGDLVLVPRWRITLTGVNDAGRHVRTVVAARPWSATTASPPGPPAPAGSPVHVPIQIVDNIVLVPLTLNHGHGATFLLDTGAQFTIVTPELADRIGVVVPADAPTRTVMVVGGAKITIPFVRLPVIELGSGRLEDVEVGVHAVAPEAPLIDGLLGGDILGRFTMTVDPATRQLRLEPARQR